MKCWIRRSFVFVSLLGALLISGPSATTPEAPDGAGVASTEVRLRKLHLVRPDLIPYPIAYEVCC